MREITEKALAVIDSCTTPAHFRAAARYVGLLGRSGRLPDSITCQLADILASRSRLAALEGALHD